MPRWQLNIKRVINVMVALLYIVFPVAVVILYAIIRVK